MAYDPSNIFAKILRSEIPAIKVHESAQTLAIMDIMPRANGHVLVIPKAPSRNLLDADPAALAGMMADVQKIARAVKAAFDAEGIMLAQYNEPAAGQTVFHLHVHIIPRFAGVALRPHGEAMAKPEHLAEHAAKIRNALAELS